MALPRLSVAIVTYRTDPALLDRCLQSLARSVARARDDALVDGFDLFLIDNGPPRAPSSLESAMLGWPAEAGAAQARSGHGNIGYGRANNLVLGDLRSDVHIVMNPDVELDVDTIGAALAALREHPEVGLVAPAVFGADGKRQYVCKRYPSLAILFLRGFAPAFVRRPFQAPLDRYEMRDAIGDRFVSGIPLASGCFMAIRTALFRQLGGFDARYFMYFEDYDLSLRLARARGHRLRPRSAHRPPRRQRFGQRRAARALVPTLRLAILLAARLENHLAHPREADEASLRACIGADIRGSPRSAARCG
jgi:GT2 family glycosyltransferase